MSFASPQSTAFAVGLAAIALVLAGCESDDTTAPVASEPKCSIPAHAIVDQTGTPAVEDANGCISATDHAHVVFAQAHTADAARMTVSGTFDGSYVVPLMFAGTASGTAADGWVGQFFRDSGLNRLDFSPSVTENGFPEDSHTFSNTYRQGDDFTLVVQIDRLSVPNRIQAWVDTAPTSGAAPDYDSATTGFVTSDVTAGDVMGISLTLATIRGVSITTPTPAALPAAAAGSWIGYTIDVVNDIFNGNPAIDALRINNRGRVTHLLNAAGDGYDSLATPLKITPTANANVFTIDPGSLGASYVDTTMIAIVNGALTHFALVTLDAATGSTIELGLYNQDSSGGPPFSEPIGVFDATFLDGMWSGIGFDAAATTGAPALAHVFTGQTFDVTPLSSTTLDNLSASLAGMSEDSTNGILPTAGTNAKFGVFQGTLNTTYPYHLITSPDGVAFALATCFSTDANVCGDGAGGTFAIDEVGAAGGGWTFTLFTP